jgi:hypothetical protein
MGFENFESGGNSDQVSIGAQAIATVLFTTNHEMFAITGFMSNLGTSLTNK